MRKQTKLVAVLSAAALLAIGASMTSFAAAGWAEDNGTWVWLDKDGDRVYDTWKKSGNLYFYLDENGEMATEKIIDFDSETYYVDANGAKVTNRWVSVDNEDGATVAGNEVDTLWYYFGSTGKATRATKGETVVKEINSSGTKLKYIFNTEGHMMSGWQKVGDKNDLYYLGDENQGWALTGWQFLEPSSDSEGAYDDSKWFYFDGGKAVISKTKYIKGSYYTFDKDGVMADGWYGIATPPEASGSNAYAASQGSVVTGWVYTTAKDDGDGDSHWYYLGSKKDASGAIIARGIPFNLGGKSEYQAKSIKGKIFLFKNDGVMQTGVKQIKADLTTDTTDAKALKAGYYYFNKGDGSVNGQMVSGKVTIEDDGEKYYYNFDKDGRAFTDKIKDGCLYGADGRRINAEDGNTYRLYTVTVDTPVVGQNKTVKANTMIAVNSSGRVKTSGTVKVDDVTYEINSDTYAASVQVKK